jgi:tetrapyrrole methylase family protein/MazG family protein
MESYTIEDLIKIVKRLREPDGCPWDRVQTHDSIKKDLIEESYEALDALENGSDKDFANELGDVLLQVVFHSVLASERGAFGFDDVVAEICDKLISRHTHVFGKDHAGNVEEALTNWEKNKKKEKGLETYTQMLKDVPKYYPALMRAKKVQKKASGVGFDWTDIEDVYAKMYEEIDELKEAQKSGDSEHIDEEFGDVLFAAVNLSRFLKVDAETSLTSACNKFISRFEKMEKLAVERGLDLAKLSLEESDALWNEIKRVNQGKYEKNV